MAHKLAVIAVIGLTASAVFIGAAAAIGGRNFGEGLDDFSPVRQQAALRSPARRHRRQP
jgi:hypothetical protein